WHWRPDLMAACFHGGCARQVINGYIGEARAALAAAAARDGDGGDDSAAAAALGLVGAVLEMSPRMEAALELRARALLALRRYRDVAEMLRDYIPSCAKSCAGDDTATSSSSTSCSSGSGDLACASRAGLLSPGRELSVSGAGASRFLCCLDVSEIKRRVVAGLSRSSEAETQWRYLVLGQACFHLGLMEDAVVLLQTGRRLATAAFRRESVCWSEDSFSPSNSTANVPAASRRAPSKYSQASGMPPASEADSVSQLLAHVKLLLRRRAAAVAALDAGLPAEAVRHFNKVLDARRGGVLPHSFATACLVGRAAAFRASGRPADAIADCNRALALDPAFIPALRARADLLESVGAIPDSLRDLDHLKLLYDAALRDGKLPGPSWRPQGGVRQREIAGAHRELVARVQQLRARVAAGDGCNVDYYALLGVPRGCARSEVVRAHLLLTLKLKPDRSASFAERLELVDEHRDLDAVRDQARMSALFLYRMLQKGYSHIMSAVLDEEAAARQRRSVGDQASRRRSRSVSDHATTRRRRTGSRAGEPQARACQHPGAGRGAGNDRTTVTADAEAERGGDEPDVPGRVLPRHGGGRDAAVPRPVRPAADGGQVRGDELL
uniref:J domain-containing protein n=1 Tax=Aegilops tauschii subsp. strangulata TaxID=200361 RepID=A0A453ALD4_AEGTS